MPPIQFEDPASFTAIDYASLNGCLLLFEVTYFEDHVQTQYTPAGEKSPAVRANVTVLDGHQAGTVLADALVFPKVLVNQLRSRVGRAVLGRLTQGQATPGRTAAWQLEAATPADRAAAERFLNGQRVQQAATPASEPPF